MAQIPLYQQQVQADVQQMPRGSMEAAAAPWRGVAKAGQAISQVSGMFAEYQQKKQAQKNALEESNYKNSFVLQQTEIDAFRAAEKKAGRTVSEEQVNEINDKYTDLRKGFISRMSKAYQKKYNNELEWDTKNIAKKTRISFDIQETKKNSTEFEANVTNLAREGKFDEAKALIDQNGSLVDSEKIEMKERVLESLRIHNYNLAIERPSQVVQGYADGSISYDDALSELKSSKDLAKEQDFSSGQIGNVKRSINAAEKQIKNIRINGHKTTADAIVKDVEAGLSISRANIQGMLDRDEIDELGASKIARAVWKRDNGFETPQNRQAFGKATSDINNGVITTFEQLEDRQKSMTPQQYTQAEDQLATLIGDEIWEIIDYTDIEDALKSPDATVSTLIEQQKEIMKSKLPASSKEALMIIAENAFNLNQNPELAEGYASAITDIMELERYLDLSMGNIGYRLNVYKDMTLDELNDRKEALKASYDNQVQKKVQEDLSEFQFSRTVSDIVTVTSPDGVVGTIPRDQLGDAIKEGYTVNAD